MSTPATATQELTYAQTGQSLIYDDPDGRPSAVVSVSVWPQYADDSQTAEAATTGSGAVETNPNTTLTAAAGRDESDPTALALTAATGVAIGRRLLLTEDSTGVSEWLEIASLNGLNATATRPLRNVYSAGATLVSTRCTISVDSTWIAELANRTAPDSPNASYRVRWTVTRGGVNYVRMRTFDVLQYPSSSGVTPMDMDTEYPGWIDRLPPDNQVDQGRSLLDRADSNVRAEFRGDGKNYASLRDPAIRAHLVMRRAMLDLIRDQALRGAAVGDGLALAKEDWRQAYDQHIRARVALVDTSGGGASQPVRPRPLTVR